MKSGRNFLHLSLGVALTLIFGVAGLQSACAQGPRPGRFTFPPRSIRSRDIDQKHIKLELAFNFDKQEVKGKATLRFAPYRPLTTVAFDAADLKIDRVTHKEKELKHTVSPGKLELHFDEPLPQDVEQEVVVEYLIVRPQHGVHFVIPDASEPQNLKMAWTQCEPEFARYWFPCLDTSTDRITSEIIATVPEQLLVLSNGVLESKKKNGDGTQTWHWSQKQTHVTYLMSIVVGDFEVYEQSWDGIPIQSYVPRGMLEHAPRNFEKTPAMVKFFSQIIGHRYPWPKYAQICVDEYAWGGMEHTSATTLNLDALYDANAALDSSADNLVAHELAHQWFGDLLTCKDWAELWLNESFATYFATLWTEADRGWDAATWERHEEANAYLDEDSKYRRSIVNYRYTDPNDMFDNHTYPKGARVLHMLRFELGEEDFWKAIRRYVEINQYRTVETSDLRVAISDATGQELNWFFDQWIYKGGHPELDVSWRWDEPTKSVQLTVKQTQKVDDLTPLFRFTSEVDFAVGGDIVRRTVVVSKDSETYSFPLAARPTRVVFDPRDIVLKTMNFPKSREELIDQLLNDQNVIARKQAADGLKSMAAEPVVKAALIRSARNDPFWAVRRAAVYALNNVVDDAVRQTAFDIACGDGVSAVRVPALEMLGKYPTDEVKRFLRERLTVEKSYHAASTALRVLAGMDGEAAVPDLIAAMRRTSAGESILRAACDALVGANRSEAIEPIQKLLSGAEAPQRRVVLMGALASLKGGDAESIKILEAQMNHARAYVRKAAYEALAKVGNRDHVAILQAKRSQEYAPDMIKAVDEAIEKLNATTEREKQLQQEVELLRKKKKELEARVKELEARIAP